jgi:hypothetical protein
MPKAKTKKEALHAPPSLVARLAERLHRFSPERREHAIAAAKTRLKGKHPRMKDAAIVAAHAHQTHH